MAPATPAHWIISQGRLTGNALSTPLLSGWTLGDFELRFQWTVGPGGAWNARAARRARRGRLATDAQGRRRLRRGARWRYGAGRRRRSRRAVRRRRAHTADIRRSGTHAVGDRRRQSRRAKSPIDRNRRFGLSLSVPAGEATLDELRLEEPRGNPLFNGKDLTGWFVNNGKGTWAVDNGDIIPTSHRGLALSADRQGIRQLHVFVRVQDLQGGQLGRRHSHGQGRLALGRRHGNANPRSAGRSQRLDDGHLRQPAAAGSGRPLGTVEPRDDQGRRPHDHGLGQRRAGAARQHGAAARGQASASQGLDRRAGSRRQGALSRALRARSTRRAGARRLVRAARPKPGRRSCSIG